MLPFSSKKFPPLLSLIIVNSDNWTWVLLGLVTLTKTSSKESELVNVKSSLVSVSVKLFKFENVLLISSIFKTTLLFDKVKSVNFLFCNFRNLDWEPITSMSRTLSKL